MKEKKYIKRKAIGIVTGVAITLFIAQLLNTFFGWEIRAAVIGLVLGLYSCFAIIDRLLLAEMHKRFLPKIMICILRGLYYMIIVSVSFYLYVYFVDKVINTIGAGKLFPWVTTESNYYGIITAFTIFQIIIPLAITFKKVMDRFDNCKKDVINNHLLLILIPLLAVISGFTCLYITKIAINFTIFALPALKIIGIATGAILTLIILYYSLLVLIKLSGHHIMAGAAEGVISGSVAGYVLTGWTKLALISTMHGILFGAFIGLLVGIGAHYLAQTDMFKRAYAVSTFKE